MTSRRTHVSYPVPGRAGPGPVDAFTAGRPGGTMFAGALITICLNQLQRLASDSTALRRASYPVRVISRFGRV